MTNDETKRVSGNAASGPLRFVIRDFVIRYSLAPVAAFLLMLSCYRTCGNCLDLFFAGFFVATLLIPPWPAIARQSPGAWVNLVAVSLAIGLVWLEPFGRGFVTFNQWLVCVVVLATFGWLLFAIVAVLVGSRFPDIAASAVVTLAALAWLTWPVWLSPSLSSRSARWLVYFHPLMAINHIVSQLGIWTEQQGAYSLTSLGQDIPYQLPRSAWPVIGLQLGLAAALSVISATLPKSRPAMPVHGASQENR